MTLTSGQAASFAAASMGLIGLGVLVLSTTRGRVFGVLSILAGALCLMALALP